MSVKIDTAKLDMILATFPGNTAQVVAQAAHLVEGYAISRAPVDTGALVNSIDSEAISELTWQVHDGVEYGVYNEFGTYRMAAHPFFAPAVERAEKEFTQKLKDMMNRL